MKNAFQCLFAPVFWVGFLGAGVLALDQFEAGTWVLLPLALLAVAVSFASELLAPYDPAWNGMQADSFRDTIHAVVNEAANMLSLLGWGALLVFVSSFVPSAQWWPSVWPTWMQLLLAMVVVDAGITLAHFASHRIPLLWKLHAVHHSVKRMYGFNGLMKHPLHQAIEGVAGLAPLLLLGMPSNIAALLGYAIAINLLLQHSNVDMRLGVLRRLFAFAPVHRFHHLCHGKAGDVNFGFFTNIWDHILGTAFYSDSYRVAASDLGIGSRPDYPVDYAEQLAEPFRAAPISRASEMPMQLAKEMERIRPKPI